MRDALFGAMIAAFAFNFWNIIRDSVLGGIPLFTRGEYEFAVISEMPRIRTQVSG